MSWVRIPPDSQYIFQTMIYSERINRPAHVETHHEGGFFVVEWSNANEDLEKVINEEFEDDGWIERYGKKEKFLKAFVSEKNGIFKIWLTADARKSHGHLFSSIPSDEREGVRAAGEFIKETMSFIIAATALYEKMFLDRDASMNWLGENLPTWA
jgi:hypothetical protein